MSAGAVLPSLIPVLVVAAIRRAEERIHRKLTEAGAVTAKSAVALSLDRSFDRRRLQALMRSGAVHATADGRHFLDAEGWTKHRNARLQRVALAVTVIVALLGIVVFVMMAMR